MAEQTVIPRDPIPLHLWGRDHWSTFGYAASIATSGKRVINKNQMRTHADRHPHGLGGRNGDGSAYATRLRDGIELFEHDDWDCLEDAVAAGLLTWGTWVNPFVVLTDAGLEGWAQLQAYENDPACKSWSKAMEGWVPSVENRGMAENGDLIYMVLNGGAR